MKLKILLLSFLAVFLMAGSAMAITVNVNDNGDMSDWGITAWTGFSTADNVNSPVTGYHNGVYYWEEDGVGANTWVEPGYGGQAYDIEALYVTIDLGNLYIGVITGFWPNSSYDMGDIGIDVDGDGIYEYGIDTTNGSFYSGLTGDDWSAPICFPSGGPVSISSIGAGTGAPSGPLPPTFFYGTGSLPGETSTMYVIEAQVSLTAINWDGSGSFHITQTCGNDVGDLSVPEPSTMLLFGTGLLGLAAIGRKKLFKK